MNSERCAAVFYLHPWELDPGQPRIRATTLKTRFRHYLNLHRTQPRLRRLLADFSWRRMDEIFSTKRLVTKHYRCPPKMAANTLAR